MLLLVWSCRQPTSETSSIEKLPLLLQSAPSMQKQSTSFAMLFWLLCLSYAWFNNVCVPVNKRTVFWALRYSTALSSLKRESRQVAASTLSSYTLSHEEGHGGFIYWVYWYYRRERQVNFIAY
ncbi:hypothetical protein BJX63DRAFT_375804 [Aspergillus granulosus]|uniref:Uncharacterized protein n=1 Tax=Aspergillus granulosus TaxID=176169 RepID=A0ABR4I571_9EURO